MGAQEKLSWDDILKGLQAIGEALSASRLFAATPFPRGGWSEVPLGNMDLDEFGDLLARSLKKSDKALKEELDRVIPGYFRRENNAALSAMVDSWYRFPEERRPVFEDALWAHKQQRYTLSIPALATQVEGVLRYQMQKYGNPSDEWKSRFSRMLGYDPKGQRNSWDLEDLWPGFVQLPFAERIEKTEEMGKHFTLFQINELYKDTDNLDDPALISMVNRHGIAHGVFLKFEEIESLKLFFILDLLHEAIGIYEELASEIKEALQRAIRDDPRLLDKKPIQVAKRLIDCNYLIKQPDVQFLSGVIKVVRDEAANA
jgi:hypothetical protein